MKIDMKTLIIILLVAAIGVGGYYYYNQQKEPADHFDDAAKDLKSGMNKILGD